MFTHDQRLVHLLRPEQYYSPSQHRQELAHLFLPAWHLVGTRLDLNNPGDYLVVDLFGHSVLVRNMDGELRAFQNVCSHRHSQIVSGPRGSSPALRCQYHGWEYTKDGRTARIPDAQAFRPFDRENSCLNRYRVEACGDLVFVCLSPAAPDLAAFLGEKYPVWAAEFGGPFRFAASWSHEFRCNWKVIVENSLESYHVPLVHPHTFKEYPAESDCFHALGDAASTFRTPLKTGFLTAVQDWLLARLGGSGVNRYEHHLVHPHLTCSSLDLQRIAMVVYPTSPTTCRYSQWLFTMRARRENPLSWGLGWYVHFLFRHLAQRIFWEDAAIYAAVQRGLEQSTHPGVIGTREERLYYFQRYVLDRCRDGGASPPPAAAPAGCGQSCPSHAGRDGG